MTATTPAVGVSIGPGGRPVVIENVDMAKRYPGAVRAYPNDGHVPGFEFSEHVAVNPGNSTQWADEMAAAKQKLAKARSILEPFVNASVPDQAADMALPQHQPLADALRGARKLVAAGPEERPRFHPDGSMWPEHAPRISDWHVRKVGEELAMVPEPYAQVHLDTIVFRIPKRDMVQVAALAVDDAITTTREFGRLLNYKNNPYGKPHVPEAIKKIDASIAILDAAVRNKSTQGNVLNRIENRLWQMPKWQSRAAIGALVLTPAAIAGTAAFLIRKNAD
jgi:hypothetical protein